MDILVEQLVYGSFPFWDRGYDVLARSPGCRAEWVRDVLSACRKLGEAPSGLTPAPALFATRLPSGPWAVVGVEPLGVDDRGRPGALAFHALLIDPADYRKAGANPFAFEGSLRQGWNANSTLDSGFCSVEIPPLVPTIDPRIPRIAKALARGRRVAIESASPIDALAREVWPSLPESTRRRASVATWAFGNANRFDLVAFPRLAGVELDRTYLEPGAIDLETPEKTSLWTKLPHSARWAIPSALLVLIGLAWQASHRSESLDDPGPPAESIDKTTTIGSEDRRKILNSLETLADRFELGGSNEPGALLSLLAERFHYRGSTLKPAELAKLEAEPDPDRDRAIAWHNRISRTFVDDRPLPDDFANLPIDQQLDRVARSFHLDPVPPASAIPEALIGALSRPGPIRPTPLAGRYPALSEYARFLGKLPRLEK
jgi:hypothetical protein